MDIAVIGTTASSLLGFRLSFIKKLIAQGHVVYALAIDFTPEIKLEMGSMGIVPIDYSISRYGLNPFLDIVNTIKLSRILSGLNVDITFCYFAKPVIFGTLAARLANIPKRIGLLEGLGYPFTAQPDGQSFKQRLIRRIQVLLYKLALPSLHRLILLNPDDKKDLIDHYKIKVKEVAILGGIGLNLEEYPKTPLSDSPNVNFTFIGRLLKEKGIEHFMAAAELVKRRFPNTVFTVLGGEERESSSAVAMDRLRHLCAKDIIQYPGQVSNIYDWLVKSSVFVLPSYREGVPRSTQEAMAVGRAVITTDVPGCRETVVHNHNGLLIPPHNSEALAEAMVYFLDNPNQIQVMGDNGHKIAVERFDEQQVNEKLYQLVLN